MGPAATVTYRGGVSGARRWAAAVLVLAGGAVGCTRTTELSSELPTTTSPAPETTDSLDQSQAATAGIAALEDLIARLLASDDPCAILTQRDVQANQLDPTLFTSSAARQVLAQGLVEVYDHLVVISPLAIRQPLEDQKGVFVQILQVIDRYADSPDDPQAVEEIDGLLAQPAVVEAQAQLNSFIEQNCV